MSERKDERWLDEQLQQAVNGAKPVFDAESWKQRYSEEYQTLLARGQQAGRPAGATSRIVRLVWRSSFAKVAVAAAIVGLVVVFFADQPRRELHPPGAESRSAAESPAKIMSMMSLRTAYQRGGFDALDRQLQDTLDEFGPRSSSVPIRKSFGRYEGIEESKG